MNFYCPTPHKYLSYTYGHRLTLVRYRLTLVCCGLILVRRRLTLVCCGLILVRRRLTLVCCGLTLVRRRLFLVCYRLIAVCCRLRLVHNTKSLIFNGEIFLRSSPDMVGKAE